MSPKRRKAVSFGAFATGPPGEHSSEVKETEFKSRDPGFDPLARVA